MSESGGQLWSYSLLGFLQGYVELAIICAFTRMIQHLRLPPGLKPEEVNKPNIVKAICTSSLKDDPPPSRSLHGITQKCVSLEICQ